MTPNQLGYTDVEVAELAALSGVHIVDVREREEFEGELGHLPRSESVPLSQLTARAVWPKDAPLLVVCRSGRRSAQAAATLARAGYRHVLNLRGGLDACVSAGVARELGPCLS